MAVPRAPRALRAAVAAIVLLSGVAATLAHAGSSAVAATPAQAGHWTCVTDTYSQNPNDGTLGCPPYQYPVWVTDRSSLNYLAMGDSYSSGESVTPYFDSKTLSSVKNYDSKKDGCHRSTRAPASWITAALTGLPPFPPFDTQFIACSGATTDQMLGINGQPGSNNEAPQVTQLADVERDAFGGSAPDLITLTGGGDDANFTPVLTHCVEWGCSGSGKYVTGVTANIVANTTKLANAYATIAANASWDTSVLVANYPAIMPAKFNNSCSSLDDLLHKADQAQINKWGVILNKSIAQATARAGVNLVNVVPTFSGHQVCDHNAWINGLIRKGIIHWSFDGSFHPNLAGQKGYATAFLKYINTARDSGASLTSAGLPADPRNVITVNSTVRASALPNAQLSPSAAPAILAAGSVLADTVQTGELTISPHVVDPNSCPTLFHGGQVIDVAGTGYSPGASVTFSVMPRAPEATTQLLTADDAGQIATTVQLPATLTGLQLDGAPFGYVEAEGPGADATTQSNNNLFGIGTDDATCGVPPATAASATISVLGTDGLDVPAVGAVFAMTGPGLPATTGDSPTPGTFAELDTDSDGNPVCPTTEPTGVSCADGTLAGLTDGEIYTATEVSAPNGFTGAPPQTFQAAIDDTPWIVGFVNTYVGPPPPADVTVALVAPDLSELPAGAVFAVSGPGLPTVAGAAPAAGTFAELDTASYTPDDPTDAVAICPDTEPAGVTCADGLLRGLSPGAAYTITEVSAPPSFAIAGPQTVTTSTDGSPTVATFVNVATAALPMPQLNWTTPAPLTYGTALSGAQLNATASVAGTFSYSPAAGTILGAGSQTLTAAFAPTDTANYSAASKSVAIFVNPATPALNWASPLPITYGTLLSPTQLNATSPVAGVFSYSPAAGSVLGAGPRTLTVTFQPTDSTDYTAASATSTLVVAKATPKVPWTTPTAIHYGTALSSAQLNATTSVPGIVTYTPALGTVLQPGVNTLTANFVPTDAADYTTVSTSTTISVGFSQACITTTRAGSLAIAAGQSICVGAGGKVNGPVTIAAGGALWVSGGAIAGPVTSAGQMWISNATIAGPLTAANASALTLCGTLLSGPLTVTGSKASVVIGGISCAGNTISGPVTITANTSGVGFSHNTVSGPVTIKNNHGGFQYSDNKVSGPLTVTGNS